MPIVVPCSILTGVQTLKVIPEIRRIPYAMRTLAATTLGAIPKPPEYRPYKNSNKAMGSGVELQEDTRTAITGSGSNLATLRLRDSAKVLLSRCSNSAGVLALPAIPGTCRSGNTAPAIGLWNTNHG